MNKLMHSRSTSHIVKILLVVLIIGLLAADGYAIYKKLQTPAKTTMPHISSATVVKTPFTEYVSFEYGFRISHPVSWGDPQVSAINGITGIGYSVTFRPANKMILINFDSDDYTYQLEKEDGIGGPISDKATIQYMLDAIANGTYSSGQRILSHDKKSYTLLSVSNEAGMTSSLTRAIIHAVPTLNVSGVSGDYYRDGSNVKRTCSTKTVSTPDHIGCFTQVDVNDLTKTLDSIAAK